MIKYQLNASLEQLEFTNLLRTAWPAFEVSHFDRMLASCAAYVCARSDGDLIGFAKLISDGHQHGFVLDPVVAPIYQGNGVGSRLVKMLVEFARTAELTYLHVDFEPSLAPFYKSLGFNMTEAGLLHMGTA
jgi:GNAT superfamily N-acetyltransferase